MAHETEITEISALAERLRPYEIRIRKISVIDDIRMTAHGAELQHPSFLQDLFIDAFVAFEMEFILRIILVPGITPAIA